MALQLPDDYRTWTNARLQAYGLDSFGVNITGPKASLFKQLETLAANFKPETEKPVESTDGTGNPELAETGAPLLDSLSSDMAQFTGPEIKAAVDAVDDVPELDEIPIEGDHRFNRRATHSKETEWLYNPVTGTVFRPSPELLKRMDLRPVSDAAARRIRAKTGQPE